MRDYSHRPNVRKFLHVWQNFLRANGEAETLDYLRRGKTTHLSYKDRMGLIQALGLK